MLELSGWPEVPAKDRPKPLFVSEALPKAFLDDLNAKGWDVVDVRLLPYDTDQERAEAIKAKLAGIRIGTIAATKLELEALELEGRTCGLIGNKEPAKPVSNDLSKQTLDSLLDFKPARAFMGVEVKSDKLKKSK